MLSSSSVTEKLSNVRFGIERLSAGDRYDPHEISLSRKSCALRVALPTLLLLSGLGLRNYPTYVATTLGTVALGGTVALADKMSLREDHALFGLQVGSGLALAFCSLGETINSWGQNQLSFYLPLTTLVVNYALLFFTKAPFEQIQNLPMKERRSFASHLFFPLSLIAFASLENSIYEPIPLEWAPLISAFPFIVASSIEFLEHEADSNTSSGWLAFGACLVGTGLSLFALQRSMDLKDSMAQWVNGTLLATCLFGMTALLWVAQREGAAHPRPEEER